MDENLNNKSNNENVGELTGFDSATTEDSSSSELPKEESGYTVTPEGGFYTKSHDDIIQDEVATPEEESNFETKSTAQEPPHYEPPKTDFRPTGTYGGNNYSAGYNNSQSYSSNPYTYNPYVKPPKPPKVRKEKRFGTATVIVASILAAVIGAVSGIVAMLTVKLEEPVVVNDSSNASNVNINIDKTVESVVEAVAEKVSPSVVGIRTTTSVMSFFGGSSEATGEGSGVIYSTDGYIITNYHVIESVAESNTNSKIEVFLNNDIDNAYEATIIGYHISSDLAVIKINAKGLKAVEIADSDELKVGQYVVAIGSPGGLEFMGSVTYGVISGLERIVSSSSGIELIQTDAAINPGNSGGAMLNTAGKLVGINSSKIVAEEYEGMGFAIPSNTVVEKCERIIQRKDNPEPYVGITISETYTADVLKRYGYPVGA
ncbi:MAG: trypsin-like peptidase domain-containing protein, partial [Clostridia bacterium]|nr:trypsin-like peptidase domain-containing protein [Clostridia bacterium]